MATTRLVMVFGGLCMYVQRKESPRLGYGPGLFVLMPSTHHFSASEQHCPVMVVEKKYGVEPTTTMYPLDGVAIDLRAFGSSTGKPVELDWVLNVSAITGMTIQDSFLSDRPAGCLASRVVLPLGLAIKPHGDAGLIFVEGVQAGVPVRGFATVEMAVETIDGVFKLNGVDLKPDVEFNAIMVYLLNVPLCELKPNRPQKSHKPGDYSDHPQAYYGLLAGWGCDGSKRGPEFIIGKRVDAISGTACGPQPCDRKRPLADFTSPIVGLRWVDTHECSQGGGE